MNEDLESVNDAWNGAWLARDVTAVETLAADEYQYIGPQGQVLGRSDIVEMIRSPSYRLATGRWTDVSISPLGADAALVLDRFQGRGEYLGRAFEEDHRHTTVWVRRHGRWQVRLEHCSAITAG
jgi:ketosteroid isomerase-like protein